MDEAGNGREVWTDGFGRTIEVDEPNSSGSLTSNTCYLYDVANNLLQVVHGTQTRSYAFDGLGRVTSATTPETGNSATQYFYTTSAGSVCSGNSANVCRLTDPRGITTTYSL